MKRPDGEEKNLCNQIDFFFFFFFPSSKNLKKWNFQNGNEKERCRSSDASVLHSFPRSSLALGRQRERGRLAHHTARGSASNVSYMCAAVISTAQASRARRKLKQARV